jgi:hypothetical protein
LNFAKNPEFKKPPSVIENLKKKSNSNGLWAWTPVSKKEVFFFADGRTVFSAVETCAFFFDPAKQGKQNCLLFARLIDCAEER